MNLTPETRNLINVDRLRLFRPHAVLLNCARGELVDSNALAAALDEDWLAPGCRNGLAPSLFSRVLITRNGCDRVLRRYPRLYGRGGPEAMGFVGPCGINDSSKIELIDVSATVGRLHDWRCYCSASNVCSRWAFYTFLDDSAVQP